MFSELLHYAGHRYAFMYAESGAALTVVEYAGYELLDLIAQTGLIPLVEVLLVLVLVFVAELEIVRLPPRSGNVCVTFGSRYDEVALSLYAQTHLECAD